MIGPAMSLGKSVPLGYVQAQAGEWALAALACPIMPAGLQRQNMKGIWELVFTDGARRLQFLPRDPGAPAFGQEDVIGTTDKSELWHRKNMINLGTNLPKGKKMGTRMGVSRSALRL